MTPESPRHQFQSRAEPGMRVEVIQSPYSQVPNGSVGTIESVRRGLRGYDMRGNYLYIVADLPYRGFWWHELKLLEDEVE